MRINKSNVRKTSNRRAHRPDQRVYRTMRLRGISSRRGRRLRMIAALAIGILLGLAIVWLFRR